MTIRIKRINGVEVSRRVVGEPEQNHIADISETVLCHHRGPQIDTIRCDQCGQGRGQMKPVYACAIHGRCTHRLEQRGQRSAEVPTMYCIGCPDGPWPPPE